MSFYTRIKDTLALDSVLEACLADCKQARVPVEAASWFGEERRLENAVLSMSGMR